MASKRSSITIKFGLKLKMERTKKSLSQEKLAELAGISATSIGAIERGTSVPSLDTIAALAKALGMEITELINTDKVEL